MPYRTVRPLFGRPALASLAASMVLAVPASAFAADLNLRPTRHEPVGSDVVRVVPQGQRGSFRAGASASGAVGLGGSLRVGDTTIGVGVGGAASVGASIEFDRGVAGAPPARHAVPLPMPAERIERRRSGDVPIAVVPPGNLPPVTVPAIRPIVEEVAIEEELPPPLPRSTLRLPSALPESSFVRIGRPASETRVADGRIDRPELRPGSAGELPTGDDEGGLVVVRQELDDLVTQVARFYGFDAVLTRQVRGTVENERLPSNLNAFIERLTTDRDLVFYFRNRDLNVSARSENVSRVIGLGPSDPRELRAAIEAAGVDADRFPLRFIEASNSVLVDGPPSFVALVEVIAESLVRTTRSAPAVTVIRGNQIDRQSPESEAAPAATVPPAE